MAIEELGYASGEQLLKSEGLLGAYSELYTHLDGSFAGVITNTEALQGAMALMSDSSRDFFGAYREGLDGATAAGEAIQTQSNQWERLDSKMKELSITVGNSLAPTIASLLDNEIIPGINAVIAFWVQGNNASNSLKALGIIAGAISFAKLIGALKVILAALVAIKAAALAAAAAASALGVLGGQQIGGALSNAIYGSGLSPREQGLTTRAMQQFGAGLSRDQFMEAIFAGRVESFGGGQLGDILARITHGAQQAGGRGSQIYGTYLEGSGTQPAGTASSFAMGGYTGAGGRSQVAGMVHRGEYVVPQNGSLVLRGGGGGSQVNVYGPVNVNADNAQDFAREMAEAVRSL